MAGYANRLITLEFPDLSNDGDLVSVTIKNPKTLPLSALQPPDLALDADGKPVVDAETKALFTVLAGIITAWNVYDGTLDNPTEALPLPATADAVATLPLEIINALGTAVNGVVTPPQ